MYIQPYSCIYTYHTSKHPVYSTVYALKQPIKQVETLFESTLGDIKVDECVDWNRVNE